MSGESSAEHSGKGRKNPKDHIALFDLVKP
jgi:hypothetical protein